MAVVIETTLGDITIDLYTKERPKTCLNFLKLCKLKYYNFNLFHSVHHNFIAQTGDPSGSGHGGESVFGQLYGEQARYYAGEQMPKIKHSRAGLVSMVNCGDSMLGAQFFITLGSELSSLDGEHCVFGEVAEGEDVLLKLNETICDESHRPYQDIRITHTVILEDPFDDPPNLQVPNRSPSPSKERLMNGRIAPDEAIDEMHGKTMEEIDEMVKEKEAAARATILEIVGDLPDADMAPPENVLFVCKLNPVTNDDDLEIIFSRFGKINSCEVIRDKVSGDSLQYAFIEFAEQKSCEDAYFKMDNVLIDDRRIHVDFSQSVSKVKWKGKGRGVEHVGSKPGEKVESERHRNNKNSGYDRSAKSSRAEASPPRKKRVEEKRDSYREREEMRRREERERRHRDYARSNSSRDRRSSRDRSGSHNKVQGRDRPKDKSKERSRSRDRNKGRSQHKGRSRSPGKDRRPRDTENGESRRRETEKSQHKDEKARETSKEHSKQEDKSTDKTEVAAVTELKKSEYKKASSATSTPQLESRESSTERTKSKCEVNGKKTGDRSSSVKSKEEKPRGKKRSRSSSHEKEVKVVKQKRRKESSSSVSSSESSSEASSASSQKHKHREKRKKKKKIIIIKKKVRASKHKKKKARSSSDESSESDTSDSESEPPKPKHRKSKKKLQIVKIIERKASHKKKRRKSVTSSSQSSSSSESESSGSVAVKKKKSKKSHKAKVVSSKKKKDISRSKKRKVETESSDSSSAESYSKKRKSVKKSVKKRPTSESESSSD